MGAGHDAPLADGLFNRGQSAPQKDRGGDHRAGGQLTFQHQKRAETQHRRLQEKPEGFGHGGKGAGQIAGLQRAAQRLLARALPAAERRTHHAQGLNGFRLMLDLIRHQFGPQSIAVCLIDRALGHALVHDGDHHQDQTAHDRGPSQNRVKDENRREKQQRPRDIEDRHQYARGPEPLDRLQIALRGRGKRIARQIANPFQSRRKYPQIQGILHLGTDTGHDPGADKIQNAHDDEQEHHQ